MKYHMRDWKHYPEHRESFLSALIACITMMVVIALIWIICAMVTI